jgi:hypothetical protein
MNGIAEELMTVVGKFKIYEDPLLAIDKAKSAHMIFIGKVKSHVDGSANIKADQLPTHLTCAFGKWYQSKGNDAYGHNEFFRRIDTPHAKVHDLGKQAINAYNSGDKNKALFLCAEMESNSMELVDILNHLTEIINAPAGSVKQMHRGNDVNCWEQMKCGREAGGAKVKELGVCPAYPNHGKNCVSVPGTLCDGKSAQNNFTSKLINCMQCEFYNCSEHHRLG